MEYLTSKKLIKNVRRLGFSAVLLTHSSRNEVTIDNLIDSSLRKPILIIFLLFELERKSNQKVIFLSEFVTYFFPIPWAFFNLLSDCHNFEVFQKSTTTTMTTTTGSTFEVLIWAPCFVRLQPGNLETINCLGPTLKISEAAFPPITTKNSGNTFGARNHIWKHSEWI